MSDIFTVSIEEVPQVFTVALQEAQDGTDGQDGVDGVTPALRATGTALEANSGAGWEELIELADLPFVPTSGGTVTGNLFAPTAPATTNNTQLASTAFARSLAYRRFASTAEAAGTPVSGTVLLRLDEARTFILSVGGNTTFDIFNFGETNVSDRGEFVLTFSFEGSTLRTIEFGDNWIALDPVAVDNRFATYIVNGVIANGKVFYSVEEYFFIDESEFTHTLMMVGDLGEDSGPAFTTSMNYLAAQSMDYLLYAGDVNYPSGSSSTINAHTAPLNALIAAEKVLVCHGNHDLDTIAQNWTTATSPMALAGTWRWSNSSGTFVSDFRTNAATSAGWATVTGGVPGFGESDTGTGAITDDDSATYYFARVLNLGAAPTVGQKVRIRMYIDDGARVFINGVLVYDFHCAYPVSDSSLAHYAMSATADSDGVWTERGLHSILVDGACLQAGNNLIAVEVHQSATNSSDISWDMAIDVGTTTDHVPDFSEDRKYVNGYGQSLRNKFSYLPNAAEYYHYTVGDVADVFVLNDGFNSSVKNSNPSSPLPNGAMHEWFANELAASTRPFKIVMVHRCSVSTYNSSSYWTADLDWPEFKDSNVLLVFGHTHQTCHYSHTSGQHVINASNSGAQSPRAIVPLVGVTTGYTVEYADASTDYAVARIQVGENFLRVKFERTSDGAILHQFVMTP